MQRLRKLASNEKENDLQKSLHHFRKQNKLKKSDLKNKEKSNPLYKKWNDHVVKNYPQYTYDPNFISRGWGYMTSPLWWNSGSYSNDNDDDDISSNDIDSIDSDGGDSD